MFACTRGTLQPAKCSKWSGLTNPQFVYFLLLVLPSKGRAASLAAHTDGVAV